MGGGYLVQHGQVNGRVLVEPDGVLEQHGQVNGDIRALSGSRVRLWGQVNGRLFAESGSDFRLATGVMVLGPGIHGYVTPEGTWGPLGTGAAVVTSIGTTAQWRLTPTGGLEPA